MIKKHRGVWNAVCLVVLLGLFEREAPFSMLKKEEGSLEYNFLSASVVLFGLLRLSDGEERIAQADQTKMLRRLFRFLDGMLIQALLPQLVFGLHFRVPPALGLFQQCRCCGATMLP